jgi:DNA-binding NtrC family response regulator
MSAEQARAVPLGRTTVVVAEGDVGARESLRMILAPHHHVFTASCADALFDLLVRGRANAVVLDLRLPGAPPRDLLRGLRREFPEVALVVVASSVSLAEAAEAMRAGVCDLLQKPFDVNEVGASVARAVGGQRQRARLAGFLRALGQAVGQERRVSQILREVDESPPLRHRLSDLISRISRQSAAQQRLREDSMAAPSASNEGAWR